MKTKITYLALGVFLGAFLNAQVFAQEVLPRPEPPFKGKIVRDSEKLKGRLLPNE